MLVFRLRISAAQLRSSALPESFNFPKEGSVFWSETADLLKSETFAKLIERHCSPETEIVLALATNENTLNARRGI